MQVTLDLPEELAQYLGRDAHFVTEFLANSQFGMPVIKPGKKNLGDENGICLIL